MNQTTDNNSQTVQNEVIDLRELFVILKRHKKLIWSITTLFTLLALMYILLKTPIYEVKSNVMVGYMDKNKEGKRADIANPAVIAKRLNVVFNVEDKPTIKNEFISEVSSVSINKKLKNFITIKTKAISNEEALKKNKEAVRYLQNLYQPRINQYITNTKNRIRSIKQEIINVDDFKIKNIKEEIKLLKTQKIVKIDEKINFYKNIKLKSVEIKIDFHSKKLKEYIQEIDNLYKKSSQNTDVIVQSIASMQMLNYQNMILSSQNKIEDLNIEKEIINNEKIVDLEREKENINNDTIRKLNYKIGINLVNEKRKLKEKIQQLTYKMSSQNIQNSKVIGEYIIKESPVKPKKKLIVIVAFIAGLMLSIFLAFFLEFLRGMKKEEEDA